MQPISTNDFNALMIKLWAPLIYNLEELTFVLTRIPIIKEIILQTSSKNKYPIPEQNKEKNTLPTCWRVPFRHPPNLHNILANSSHLPPSPHQWSWDACPVVWIDSMSALSFNALQSSRIPQRKQTTILRKILPFWLPTSVIKSIAVPVQTKSPFP